MAAGTIAAVDRGRIGEGYILGNDVVWMKDMFLHISRASGVKMVTTILPMPVTRVIVKACILMGKTRPFAETIYDEVEWLKAEHRVIA